MSTRRDASDARVEGRVRRAGTSCGLSLVRHAVTGTICCSMRRILAASSSRDARPCSRSHASGRGSSSPLRRCSCWFLAGREDGRGVEAAELLEIDLLPAAKGTFIGVAIHRGSEVVCAWISSPTASATASRATAWSLGPIVGRLRLLRERGLRAEAMIDNLDTRPIGTSESEAFRAGSFAVRPHHLDRAAGRRAVRVGPARRPLPCHARLVLTGLGVMSLHVLWDQSDGWALMLTAAC